ncbi:gluconokinase [Spiroplasma helicoides]|uniref:Gluconokinase n=1 Tax=Spiroplasma helicoides TaxID=216938 RepID=A0A1B3SLX6_9MOLU|nr:FGGY family carbohydrate kinase [Spiroplasma helicoides]AOG60923.1 gluconokinase [Spiroplasma helicoides]
MNIRKNIYVSIDLGTTFTKISVFSKSLKKMEENNFLTPYIKFGVFDIGDLERKLEMYLLNVIKNYGDFNINLTFTTAHNSLILLNENNQIIFAPMNILYEDFELLNVSLNDAIQLNKITGMIYGHHLPLAKLCFIKNDPNFKFVNKIHTLKSYLLKKIFNIDGIDYLEAAGLGLLDIEQKYWSKWCIENFLNFSYDVLLYKLPNLKTENEVFEIIWNNKTINITLGLVDGFAAHYYSKCVLNSDILSINIGTTSACRINTDSQIYNRDNFRMLTNFLKITGYANNNGGNNLYEYAKINNIEMNYNNFENAVKLIKKENFYYPNIYKERFYLEQKNEDLRKLKNENLSLESVSLGILFKIIYQSNLLLDLNNDVKVFVSGGFFNNVFLLKVLSSILKKDIYVCQDNISQLGAILYSWPDVKHHCQNNFEKIVYKKLFYINNLYEEWLKANNLS